MIKYLLAMEREAELFEKYAAGKLGGRVYVVGIGATGIDNAELIEDDVIVNVGYAGGYEIPVGTIIEPSYAMDMRRGEIVRIDSVFPVERRVCITSDTFVDKPMSNGPHLYDMELFKVASVPHKKLYSLKIISDNLCEEDCEAYNAEESWRMVVDLIERNLPEARI